ncbi:MAG: hypothetical protein CMG01_03985 [Candidatus Marinimicrobia bacterium]|nr:hypothetical protein [Candidatus Neomarinimicrobiota bacterium]
MKLLILCMIFNLSSVYGKLPNDVRWVIESSEYEALCHQIFNNAIYKLKKKLSPNNFSLNIANNNYAVVLDLDETIMDNSDYQVMLFDKNEKYNPESWDEWVLKEDAKLVPGARKYLNFLRDNNIQVIFLSNRMDKRVEETKNNLKKLGVFSDNDIYLLRLDKADKKTVRREEIFNSTGRMKNYNNFEIIQYLGDAMGDFEDKNLDRFGIDNFVFPNPMYGKW